MAGAILQERWLRHFQNPDSTLEHVGERLKDRANLPWEVISEILRSDSGFQEIVSLLRTESAKGRKSEKESEVERNAGNRLYGARKYEQALDHYSKAVCLAPDGTLPLSQAYANRSMAYLSLKQHSLAIEDAKAALSLPYPDPLRPKIYLRLSKCHQALGKIADALATAWEGIALLTHVQPSKQLEDLRRELMSLVAELQERVEAVEPVCGQFWVPAEPQPHPWDQMDVSASLPAASKKLQISQNEKEGRYLKATSTCQAGDVLVCELPYAWVARRHTQVGVCDYCLGTAHRPIPCPTCTSVVFCSSNCLQSALTNYHSLECTLPPSLLRTLSPQARLSIRILARHALSSRHDGKTKTCNVKTSEELREVKGGDGAKQNDVVEVDVGGNWNGSSDCVRSLVTHRTDLPASFFAECVAAVCLVFTSFEGMSDVGWWLKREEMLDALLQVRCNGISIKTAIRNNNHTLPQHVFGAGENEEVGLGVYPTASLLNHSCSPNAVLSFDNKRIVVRATSDIHEGNPVSICYGPQVGRMGVHERKEVLRAQYGFECKCEACGRELHSPNSFPLDGYACPSSIGNKSCKEKPLQRIEASDCWLCGACGRKVADRDIKKSLDEAQRQWHRAEEEVGRGNTNASLSHLSLCLKYREECLFPTHVALGRTWDRLAELYALTGQHRKAVEYCLKSTAVVKKRFGDTSVEYSHELAKLGQLYVASGQPQPAVPVLQKALRLLEVHFGANATDVIVEVRQILANIH